jgi:hypothetical protein
MGPSERRKSLKREALIGSPSKAMTVLLDFWPMARDLGKNRMTKFQPEVLSMGRSHGP